MCEVKLVHWVLKWLRLRESLEQDALVAGLFGANRVWVRSGTRSASMMLHKRWKEE